MSEGKLRLFFAASVPDDQLGWVADGIRPLRERWPHARWTPRANQHVTLKFLGSTPAAALDDIVTACRALAATVDSGSVSLSGLGAFPNARRARVLWVGLEDPLAVLARLAAGLDEALEPLGIAKEKRSFSAHLTVARFKAPEKLEALPELDPAPAPFPVDHFVLWRSHLSPRAARYEELDRFTLKIE